MDQRQEEFDDVLKPQDDDVWSEDGWYFDLPAGAWERQEAKNRALRANIRANVKLDSARRALEQRKDPFGATDAHDLAGWVDELEGGQPAGPAQPWGDDADWDPPASDEPDDEWLEVEAQPDPMAETDWDFSDSPLAASRADIADEWQSPAPAASTSPPGQDPPTGSTTESPRSRWDEMFGSGEPLSIVDAMREWSAKGNTGRRREPDLSEIDPELLKPFDWELEGPAADGDLPAPPAAEPYPSTPEPAIQLVDGDALEAASWNEFAVPPGEPSRSESSRKGGLLSRVFGKRTEPAQEGPEWARDTAGWTPEPPPVPASPPPEEWAPTEGRDDDTPLDFRPARAAHGLSGPATRMKGLAGDTRPGPVETRGWGAPPTDDDGSRRYDLPRRFAGRNVWDDEWLEKPPPDLAELSPHAQTAPAPEETRVKHTAPGGTQGERVGEAIPSTPPDAITAPMQGSTDDSADAFGDYFDAGVRSAEAPSSEHPDAGPNGHDSQAPGDQVTHLPITGAETDTTVPGNFEQAPFATVTSAPEGAATADPVAVPTPEGAPLVDPVDAKQKESGDAAEADTAPRILHAEWREPAAASADGGAPIEMAGDRPSGKGIQAPEDAEPPPREPDDPWAAFLVAQDGGGAHPFVSPATGTSGEPVSWETVRKPGDAFDAEMTSKEAQSNSSEPADDRWAEIVAVTGYDDDPAVPIYTGRREPPLEPQRRLPESALLDLQPGPAARPHLPPLEGGASPPPALDEPPPAAWEEDDVVLRAFEEHARAEPAFPRTVAAAPFAPADDGAIGELLGSDADAIVDEAMSSLIEGSTAERDPARQPMPWEDPPPPPPVEPESQGWEQPPAYDDDALEGDEPLYSAAAAPFPGSIPPADVVPATVLKARKPRGRTVARELVETLLLALLVFLAVRASFQNFKVDGNSMYPTLENGEFLIVNKLVYSEVDVDKLSKFLPFLDAGGQPRRYVFHGPERGDIIVLQDPRDPSVDLIKRVIGLPGETVEIVNGVVFINGLMLEEPYITQPWHYTGPPITLGAEEYFVMGDNRDNSKDSRSVGPIPKELIIGKAMLTYWPASHFGLAPNESPKVTDTTIQAYREEHGLAAFAR